MSTIADKVATPNGVVGQKEKRMSQLTLPEAMRAGGKIASRCNGAWFIDRGGQGCCVLGAAMLALNLTQQNTFCAGEYLDKALNALDDLYPELQALMVTIPIDARILDASVIGPMTLSSAVQWLSYWWSFDEIADWVEGRLAEARGVVIEGLSLPGISLGELIEVG